MTTPSIVTRSQKVVVRGLRLEAMIGVHGHERARAQPLVLDVEVELAPEPVPDLSATFNYEAVVLAARNIIAGGHIDLVETLARSLAEACLGHAAARRVRVCVLKPKALAPDADAAGVEIVLERSAP